MNKIAHTAAIEQCNRSYRGYAIRVLLLGRGAKPYTADICDDDGRPIDSTGWCGSADAALREAWGIIDELERDEHRSR